MILRNKYKKSSIKLIVLILQLALFLCLSPKLLNGQVSEYVVKASFVEKISRYIEWPATTNIQDRSSPFLISIIGRNPFMNELNKQFSNLKFHGKTVEIRQITSINEIDGSYILFISTSEKGRLTKILNYTKDKPILTIADTEGFCEIGTLINLYINEDDLVRFEINETKLKSSGLKVDLYLLEVSRIVNPLMKR